MAGGGRLIYAVTGHRPDKLGGYSDIATDRLEQFAVEVLTLNRPSTVITGMALGWDQAVAFACWVLDIPFIAAVPFASHSSLWTEKQQEIYKFNLSLASKRVIVCNGAYSPEKMMTRNRWMVDYALIQKRCKLLALWNGEKQGGTWNCVEYAQGKGMEVVNVWPVWEKWPG